MRELTDQEAARHGINPGRGEFTVAELFERFVTSHVEDHVAQLGEILAARGV